PAGTGDPAAGEAAGDGSGDSGAGDGLRARGEGGDGLRARGEGGDGATGDASRESAPGPGPGSGDAAGAGDGSRPETDGTKPADEADPGAPVDPVDPGDSADHVRRADSGDEVADGGTRLLAAAGIGRKALGAESAFPSDELALRRLLHDAVDGLQPSDGVLDHLHAAVPARRARKRQVLVGAAAAALLFGTAVPAFLHVAGVSDPVRHRTVSAGHEEAPSDGAWPDGGRSDDAGNGPRRGQDTREPSDGTASAPAEPGTGSPSAKDRDPGTSTGPGAVTSPGSTFAMTLPTCSADQLGVTASKNPPTANGTVYGSFHVSNVSDKECTVTGGDAVGFMAAGAADPARISVVQHTAGDPATQLPSTPGDTSTMALAPAGAYEVQFAFVPSATCPTKGDGGSTSPTDPGGSTGKPPSSGSSTGSDSGAAAPGAGSGSGSGTDVATDGATTGLGTQLVEDDGAGPGSGGTQDGSVSVSHTPEAGVPKAETTIPNACAGTIYKTGPVDAPPAA
ncbi:hypothetical protein, partial [Streptomyces fuscigenes]|uniref:hypothetical protein n=1 Tax=Streptomyces fuscigenes TaxID=1528880 RepID=UPI001F17E215